MKILKRFLCLFIPVAKVRHKILRHDASLIRIVENGVARKPKFRELKHVFVSQMKNATGNIVQIELPIASLHLEVHFEGNNNKVTIRARTLGTWNLLFHDENGFVDIGQDCTCASCFMNVTGGGVRIGRDCMLSKEIVFYTNDAHTLFDKNAGAILNAQPSPIEIGNHCWIGQRAMLMKNTILPDDTVVGAGAVVTKKFSERFTAIAGVPAKVVRHDVGWDRATPAQFVTQPQKK